MRSVFSTILTSCLILIASIAWGADIYVDDDNAVGPWDGTSAYPWQDIQDAVDDVTRSNVVTRLLKTPLHFVINQGQMNEAVFCYAKSEGITVYCTDQGITFGFAEGSISLKFSKGKRVYPEARGELPGKINYYIGSDADSWQTNISTFGEIVYPAVYPGIDLVYSGDQRRLKYTFYVEPGADPGQIWMIYEGAQDIRIDEQTGELVILTEWGKIRDIAPVAYQTIDGAMKHVDMQFRVGDDNSVGFVIGDYDRTDMLVLDPTYCLAYSTYLGGSDCGWTTYGDSGEDWGRGIAVDSSGNAYMTGFTESCDFPIQDAFQSVYNRQRDAFVTKLSSDGSLVYSTYLGGSGPAPNIFNASDTGYGIAVDNSGCAYVTGCTYSATGFPIKNAFQSIHGGYRDAFVTKLFSDGSLAYSTYLGGTDRDTAYSIAVDSSGNAYVTGETESAADFPIQNAFQGIHLGGGWDAFVTKLSSDGSLVYSTYLGGLGEDYGYGIAVDSAGSAHVTGYTESIIGFPIYNAFQSSYGGGYYDAFVTKLSSNGSSLVYSTFLGGSGGEYKPSIAVDDSGNAYVTGYTYSTTGFPIKNAFQSSNAGGPDVFVTKLSSNGSLAYSTYLGGESLDYGRGIAVDGPGNAYVTGSTSSTEFPIQDAIQSSHNSISYISDIFVTKLSPNGSSLVYSTYLGGEDYNIGWDVAVDSSGDAYVIGTTGDGFPIQNAFQETYGGNKDAFVLKISACPTPITLIYPNGGEAWAGGFSYNVTWTDSSEDVDHIRLLYSTDSGSTYPYTIVPNADDSGSYEWNPVPSVDSALVRVKAIAEDAGNNSLAEDESDADFTIDSTVPETAVSLSGTQGENGWYISNVEVTLNAIDNLSGVKETQYRVNSGSWIVYESLFTVTGSTVYYYSEDNVGNIETQQSTEIMIDKTSPETPVVTDDGECTTDSSQLHATWTSSDAESGVVEYEYAIGTTSGGTDIVTWTSVGTDTEATATGLSLTLGETYYFSVKAINEAGLSSTGYSDGILHQLPEIFPGIMPGPIRFDAVEGGTNPDDKTLLISNTGCGTLEWTISDNADWLICTPTSGACTDQPDPVTLSVDISELEAGIYYAVITVSAIVASNSPKKYYVTLEITESYSTTVLAPDGGETIKGGSSYEITWTTTGEDIDHIHLQYSTNSGVSYQDIIDSTPDDGSYMWNPVPSVDFATARVKAIAEDAGNSALADDESNADFTIDSSAPSTTASLIGTQGDNGWYTSDVTVTLSATDGVSGVKETQYKVNDGSWLVYESPFTVTGSNVYYYSEDNAGNIEEQKSTEIKIDKTLPSASVISSGTHAEDVWSNNDDPGFSWTEPPDTSGISGYSYEFDNSPSTIPDTTSEGTDTSKSYSDVVDGTWYFHVRAKDGAGNWGNTDHYGPVKIDDTSPPAPVISSSTHDEDLCNNSDDPCLSWTELPDTSGITGYSYEFDNSPSTIPDTMSEGESLSKCYSDIADGTWYFHVRGRDGLGNWGDTDHYGPVKIDTVYPDAPVISSSTHAEDVWITNDDPVFSWTEPYDPCGICGYSYEMDHSPTTIPDTISEGTGTSKSYSNIADGIWYFHVRAKDCAGNWGSADHYGPVKIDDTPPVAPIDLTANPSDWTNNSVFSIDWTNPSDLSSIDKTYYRVGLTPSNPTDGIWTTIKPFFAAATSEGEQVIYVWLMDGAGNIDHNNRDVAILHYDATPPGNPTSCTETHGAQNGIPQDIVSDPSFTWSGASDSASGVDNYYYYWGSNATGTSTSYTALTGYDPPEVSPGTYYLRVKTRDNAGNEASWTTLFTFIYIAPNTAPVLTGIPDQSLDEDTSLDNTINLWIYASDVETSDDGLTYTITGNTNPDCGVSIDTNRYIDINPTAEWYGTSDVTVEVADPEGLSDTDTFTITVDTVNDAPVLTGIPGQNLDEDTSLDNAIDLWTYASDVETPDSDLTFTITGNTNPDCGVSIDTNRYIDINPTAEWYGSSDVTITVTDPGSLFDTDTFTVTVNPVNDTPVLTDIPDQNLDEDTSLDNAVDLWTYASDVETSDDGLTYTITGNTNPDCGVSIDTDRYIDINPTAEWYGSSDVTVTVTDPGSLSDTDTFTVTVNSVNDAPSILSAIPDQSADRNTTIIIDLTLYESDVEDSGTSLDWYVGGEDHCNVSGEYSDDNVLIFTPHNNFVGHDYVTLYLSDSGGLIDNQQIKLTWYDSLIVEAFCPVDLIITDPLGRTISKGTCTIPGAIYAEENLNGDGEMDDKVIIPDPLLEEYSIEVVCEPGADPKDTYTLNVSYGDRTTTLAEGVEIQYIPTETYKYSISIEWQCGLQEGWNLFSFSISKCFYEGSPPANQPECVEMVDVINDLGFASLAEWFESIITSINPMDKPWSLVIGTEGVMDSDLPASSHSLKYMSVCSGYWVKMKDTSGGASIAIDGALFDPDCGIPMVTGWSIASYPLNTGYYDTDDPPSEVTGVTTWVKVPQPVAAHVFASIAGKYWLIISTHGVYDPSLSPTSSSLRYIAPCDAFWVKMTEPWNLVYSGMGTATAPLALTAPSMIHPVMRDGVNPTTNLAVVYGSVTENGVNADAGTHVQVYSDSGVLCGESTVSRKGLYEMMLVYGDDVLTPQIDGAQHGEKLTFHVDGVPTHAEGDVYWLGNMGVQIVDLVSYSVPDESVLGQNYPNPFNPETWIPYQLTEKAGVVIKIYSATGQLVRTLSLGNKPAGFYTDKHRAAHWDGRNESGELVASGVYFYSIKAGEFSTTMKMVVRK